MTIHATGDWSWLPLLKAIEAEQMRREAPLVAKIEEHQEQWAEAWAEVMRQAATASRTLGDVMDELERQEGGDAGP